MNTFSSNKNFRFDNNIKNCFRIQKQNYVPQENEDDKNKSTNNNFSSSCSSSSNNNHDMKNTIFVDEEIIFTENKIYISATERNLKQCTSNNKVYKKPFDAIGGNCSSNFNSMSSSPIDDNGKCSGKLGFVDSLCASEQIVFEKVKYDKNKKYLQPPSPSNSSEHSTISYELNQYFGNCSNRSTQTKRLSTYDNVDYEWASHDENGNSSRHFNDFQLSTKGHQQNQIPIINDNQNEFYLKNSDSWKFFNKQYLQNSKFFDNHKIIKNNTIHYESVSDSRRTSVSTLDTWVDDESFDNSFNEELEKRCTAQVRNLI